MDKVEEYRRIAWDPQTSAAMLNLVQMCLRLAEHAERSGRLSKYRAKAWQCAARAQVVNDAGKRAELLRFAGIWLSLTKPIEDELRGAYELPPQVAA